MKNKDLKSLTKNEIENHIKKNFKDPSMQIKVLKQKNKALRRELKETKILYNKMIEDFGDLVIKNYVLEIRLNKPWLFKEVGEKK